MKFFVRTFGCQMNENDSEHIAGLLAGSGADKAATPEEADVIIVNTCAVRGKSEEKLFSYLGRISALKRKKGVLVGVVGCVAQVYRDKLLKARPFLDFVVGPDNYPDLPAILKEASQGRCLRTEWGPEWREFGHRESCRESPTSGYVTVMEGCDNFCAYCVVPFSRGREKFRPFGSVIREVRDLAEAGYKEIQLLGQNVNSYVDPETGRGFAALLDGVCGIEVIEWVRFITSHPKNLKDETIGAMARNPKVCRALHLPIQSGSTSVLERMNRGYGREDYLGLSERLRAALPGILLSTDIIVGFPGETEAEFEETCSALLQVEFAGVFSFRYSPRPLTAAGRMKDDVPLEVKRRRLLSLQNLQKTIQLEINRAFVGRKLKVLCLGPSPKGGGRLAGRTEGNLVVNFASPREAIGRFVNVRITGCGAYSLHGELLS
jgi:tRNA-2-methylthio-N6-dimethylallyladenosine synthase